MKMRKGALRLLLGAVALLVALLAGSGTPSSAAPCALTPVLLDTTMNQGLQSYSQLVRGKETLVRFYFGLPSCAVSGNAVQINSATLNVKNQSASGAPLVTNLAALAPIGTSTPPLITSTVKQIDATSDPKWVVDLVGPTTASFNASFEATLNWQSKTCATCTLSGATPTTYSIAPGTRSTLITKTVAARTNALRLLIVPMILPPGLLAETDRQTLQDALTDLSRGGPFSDSGGRLSDLGDTASTAGIRYTINSGFIDLTPFLTGSPALFCGNNSNFAAIDTALASMLKSFNSLNSANPADRIVGVVPGSLSVASSANANCFEGESSPGGIDSWVRLGSIGGAVFVQELSHNWGIQPFSRSNGAYHSIYTTAHATAGDPGKTYNVLERAYVKSDGSTASQNNDRTALISNITNGVTNSNVLLENADWNDAFCFLGGPIPTLTGSACTSTRTVNGTAVGVAASAPGPALQITGQLTVGVNGNVTDTNVVSSFADDMLLTAQDPSSRFHIVERNSAGSILLDFRAPASVLGGHSSTNFEIDASKLLISSTVSRPVGTVTAELWDGAPGAAGSTKLFSTTKVGNDAPSITTATATAGTGTQIKPGATADLTHSIDVATILKPNDPKPDLLILSDTTASMGGAIANVQSSATSLIDNFAAKSGTNPCFGVADYRDFAADTGYAFNYPMPIGCGGGEIDPTQADAAKTAIGNWTPVGGGDWPEAQLYALHRLTTDTSFRDNSQKTLVWIGDAPGHDPICPSVSADLTANLTEATVTDELKTKGIKVFPFGVSGVGQSLDANPGDYPSDYPQDTCATAGSAGQATRIANATGGVFTLTAAASLSDAISKALNNEAATVTPSASCDSGLSVSFSPTSDTKLTPASFSFGEHVVIADNAKPGTHTCNITFAVSVNGTRKPELDQTQTLSYDVTNFTGDHTVVTWTASDPDGTAGLRGDVALKCGNLFHILKTNVVSDASGKFVYDTSSGCPGGAIYVDVNDGWNLTDPVKADDVTVNNVAGPPIVQISSPTASSRILQFSDLALAGNGKYANGTPVAGSDLTWTLDGNVLPQHRESVDVAPPAPNGWGANATNSHTLTLTGPGGSSDSLTFTTLGDNDDDGVSTSDEAAINTAECRGLTGLPVLPAPDSDPYNATQDNDGDGLPNSSDPFPCLAETDFEATALFSPSRFDVSQAPSFAIGGIFTPYVDLKQVPKSTVRIAKVAGTPVSGPQWYAIGWVVSGRFDGTVGVAGFSGAPLASFVLANPQLLNHTILVTVVGTTADGSKGFHADAQVYVFKSK